jgi:transcriptional regulator with PAS, ATPase and Fis domain
MQNPLNGVSGPTFEHSGSQRPHWGNAEIQLSDGSSFVRSSEKMRDIEAQAARIADSDISVLILGESGTGKEVLAKYIHMMSARRKHLFLRVNCAAMPTELLESELFGFEKGAFTGALESKSGKFEVCSGGTMFLDEIGEMSTTLQAKLLHVLQDGIYSRLGSHAPMKADVRIIAATNVDINTAIKSKKFREDLYYRLNGVCFTLPPLRERRDEIAIFFNHFMQKASVKFGREPLPLSGSLLNAMLNYPWPGNLREMENLINRYLVMGDESLILKALTQEPAVSQAQVTEIRKPLGLRQQIRNLQSNAESLAIANVLEETRWNRREAARKMKISYTALRSKIKQYDLDRRVVQGPG